MLADEMSWLSLELIINSYLDLELPCSWEAHASLSGSGTLSQRRQALLGTSSLPLYVSESFSRTALCISLFSIGHVPASLPRLHPLLAPRG
jgi:hypothetical protein